MNTKGLMGAGIAVIVVIVLGIFAWQKSGVPLPASSSPTVSAPFVTSLESPSEAQLPAIPVAGWKTYTNQAYGYSVQHPPDASIEEETASFDGVLTNAPSSCVTVYYGRGGFVHLRTKGAKTHCAVEGYGGGEVFQQKFTIAGKSYTAKLISNREDPDYYSDVFQIALGNENDVQMNFGVIAERVVPEKEYSHIKNTVIGIVESYRDTSAQ